MVWVTIDVDLAEFSDADIEDEYKTRNLGSSANPDEPEQQLQRAYMLHHAGKKDEAYEILWAMCLDKLNKVV